MRAIIVLLFIPFVCLGQTEVESLVEMPYDEMVSDLSLSKTKLDSGIALAQLQENLLASAELLSKRSTVSYLQGELDAGFQDAIQAIELFERLGKTNRVGGMYCGLGYSLKRRDMDKANRYMRLGISILENQQDSVQLEAGYNNYGVLKEMEGQLDSARHFYSLAVKSATFRKDSIGLPYALNHLAGVFLLEKDFPNAKQYFNRAYQIRRLRGEAYGVLENIIYFGDYYAAINRYDSAVYHYSAAIGQSYQVGYPYMRQYCFEQLAFVYETIGQTEDALKAQKMYSSIKDSLIHEKRTEELAKMETMFKTAEKEKENLALKQQKQEQQLVVSRQRNWIFGIGGATLVMLFLGLFILQRSKRIAKAKQDALIIEERERGLRSIIQATEDERKRIAKDLHDGIVQSLTGLSLRMQKQSNSEQVKASGLQDELSSTRSILDESIAEVRGISHQMMPRVLSEMGLVPALADMLDKSLGLTEIQYEFEHHNVDEGRFNESIEVSFYRICQELVNNIIKHSEAKSVSVQLLKTRSHLVLVVEDNGKGFEWEDSESRNGIGLMNINSRAQAINGEVNYEPSPQQGTVATIRVPLT